MAPWPSGLGTGLQNQVQRFDSARGLHDKKVWNVLSGRSKPFLFGGLAHTSGPSAHSGCTAGFRFSCIRLAARTGLEVLVLERVRGGSGRSIPARVPCLPLHLNCAEGNKNNVRELFDLGPRKADQSGQLARGCPGRDRNASGPLDSRWAME